MNKRWIIFLISMIVMGCCRTHEYAYTRYPAHPFPLVSIPVYIDENFGDADRVEIVKAIEQWNYVLNGNVELTVVQTYMNPEPLEMADIYRRGGMMIVRSVGGVRFRMDHDGHYILAFCDRVGGQIIYVLRDRLNNWDMYWIMMHEIGHILGASHDSHLMAPYYTPDDYACVDKATAAQVAKHFKIPNELNYCF